MAAMRQSPRRLLASERGAINFVTLFGILFVAAVVYLGYAYYPHWSTNREVLQAMREAAYQAWRIPDDDQIRRMIREKTDRILTIDDGTGESPVVDEGMIHVDRGGGYIYIDLSYEVPMRFPGTQKIRWIGFDNSVKTDLESPLAD